MKPVSNSASQTIARNDNTSNQKVTRTQVEGQNHTSKTPAIETQDIIFQKAIEAVNSHNDIIDKEKVATLKTQIENGEYSALKADANEYWSAIAETIIDAEYDFNK